MDETGTSLGSRIRQAREAKGLRKAALARGLGVSGQAISQWEKGVTAPTRQRLEKLAVALDTSLVWLLTGEGEEGPPEDAIRRAVERYAAEAAEAAPGLLDSGMIAMAAVTTFDRLKMMGSLDTMDGQAFWRECVANYAVLRATLLEFGAARPSEDE